MSSEAVGLLAAFEALPTGEKQMFVVELLRRLGPYDSGPLDDEVPARAGDDLAAFLGEEERESR